jgi:DNA-binding transcriptional MerR regulator
MSIASNNPTVERFKRLLRRGVPLSEIRERLDEVERMEQCVELRAQTIQELKGICEEAQEKWWIDGK